MGSFDDLIPKKPSEKANAFADLIPAQQEQSLLDKVGSYAKSAVSNGALGALPMLATEEGRQKLLNTIGGAAGGAGGIGASIMRVLPNALGGDTAEESKQRRADINAGLTSMGADVNSPEFAVGKFGTELAGTAGIGSGIANGVRAIPAIAKYLTASPRAAQVLSAIETSGMKTGAAAQGFKEGAKDLAIRTGGAALTGGLTAGAINPEDAGTGAVISGALPATLKAAAYAGSKAGGVIKPLYKKGQDLIVKNVITEMAENPANLMPSANIGELIQGSVPTSVTATGDIGLAGLSRTMQSTNPKYSIDLANRQYAQNAARTAAIENVAGNAGKIAAAKEARDLATGTLRDDVLQRAGIVDAAPVLSSIGKLLKKPDNAGKLSQQALSDFQGRIAKASQDGGIDARALYAIRKDINDVLGGKLQGEEGNLRYAAGQLNQVKSIIDDAIDKASRVVKQSSSREVVPFNGALSHLGNGMGQAPRPTWSQYLEEYTNQSKPINQMETLTDLMKRVQTGTVDKEGNLILSAPKLNNILKNETPELVKTLTPKQLQFVRNLSADLNASQLAGNAGRSPGSETVQKLATNNVLSDVFGKKIGGATPVANTLARVMQIPYGYANKQMMETMGNALLDPAELTRIIGTQEGNALSKFLTNPDAVQFAYRAAPVISSR